MIAFPGKLKRALDWLKERNQTPEGTDEQPLPLEKKDVAALFLAALLIFGPILLVLFLIAWLLL